MIWLAIGVILAGNAVAAAGAPPTPSVPPEQWIERLADPDFAVREQAERQLRALGPGVKGLLEATTKSGDIEQRLRAEQILRDIYRAELWRPSLVTLKAEKVPFLEVARAMAEQTGNLIDATRTPKSLTRPIDVAWQKTPYWQALDEACRKAEASAHPYDNSPNGGIVIRHGATGEYPAAYVGPLRLRITQYQRNWSERFGFGDGSIDRQDALSVDTALHWEQRFVLCRYGSRPRVLEAVSDAGEELAPKPQGYSGMMHLSRRQRQIEFPVRLKPPSRPFGGLKSLRVALDLVAAGEFETLTIEPLEMGRRHERAGYILELLDVKKQRDRWEYTLRWTRPAPYDKMNASDMADEFFEFVDENGQVVPHRQQRVYGDKNWAAYVLHVPFGAATPKSLEAHVALLRSTRTVEFSFSNVALGGRTN